MPRTKTTPPRQTKEKGQRSLELPEFLIRILPPWIQPKWYEAHIWREIVKSQPVATICRETLISTITALDWKIEPAEAQLRDELKSEITYYTDFFKNTGDYDFVQIVEWMGKDALDIPFGGASELGYIRDDPSNRLAWMQLLDGSTLFPTRSNAWPVGQALRELPTKPIYFPKHAINRLYMSPRTDMQKWGWGMAPPEKIFLAIEMLGRGDVYYAQLLLDTPEAGLLDLGDMEKESAIEWIAAFKTHFEGIDPFKIPVLYEHTTQARWMPFGRPPTDMMFDRITTKYAALVAAGYGLSLSDIGIQVATSGGDTLAGSIRQERKTRKTGVARLKKKFKLFFDRMLPKSLYFEWIDLDDELSVALGRARLANATAFGQWISLGVFTRDEARQQAVADGLISIPIPESIPESEILPIGGNGGGGGDGTERPSLLGRPIATSSGGHGEVKGADLFTQELERISTIEDIHLRRLIRAIQLSVSIEVVNALGELDNSEMDIWNKWHDEVLWGDLTDNIPELTTNILADARTSLDKAMDIEHKWWEFAIPKVEIAKSLSNILRSAKEHKLKAKAERRYELGETEKIEPEGIEDLSIETKFTLKIGVVLNKLEATIKEMVQNAVISGVRTSISRYSSDIDKEMILGDNVICVRNELFMRKNRLLKQFSNTVSSIIKGLLETRTSIKEKEKEDDSNTEKDSITN